MPSYPWNHPTGWIRHDLYERGDEHDSNFAYMSLDVLRERHLDAYDVTIGVVEPDEAASFSIIPNAQLAARLCSAYNDWLLERWLQEEPRLRGMLVVPAQYPEAAAREIRRLGGRDEFVGVFLPGGARIPYGNPIYDPLWAAANELGAPGCGAHPLRGRRHRVVDHRRRDARHVHRVPHALRLGDVRPPRLDPLPGDLRALPRHPRRDGRRRPRPLRRVPLEARHELEGVSERGPVVQEAAVRLRLGSRALRHAAARVARRRRPAHRRDRVPAARRTR